MCVVMAGWRSCGFENLYRTHTLSLSLSFFFSLSLKKDNNLFSEWPSLYSFLDFKARKPKLTTLTKLSPHVFPPFQLLFIRLTSLLFRFLCQTNWLFSKLFTIFFHFFRFFLVLNESMNVNLTWGILSYCIIVKNGSKNSF
jgi:hypothetical protein